MARILTDGRLASLPLTAGMEESASVCLACDNPSLLAGQLCDGKAQAALIPVFELHCSQRPLTIIPAACVSFCGAAPTLQILSHRPAKRIETLWIKAEDKSAAVLAEVIWWHEFSRRLRVLPFLSSRGSPPADAEAILSTSDSLITASSSSFQHHFDLGALWSEITGLPLVTQVWAAVDNATLDNLYALLLEARRVGDRRLADIAAAFAREHSCPVEVVEAYLTRRVQTELTDAHREGLEDFFDLAMRGGVIDQPRPLHFFETG
ncbi:MAG: MqnA/MqnD/SBP family protein [Phycisphaerae bacterium]